MVQDFSRKLPPADGSVCDEIVFSFLTLESDWLWLGAGSSNQIQSLLSGPLILGVGSGLSLLLHLTIYFAHPIST